MDCEISVREGSRGQRKKKLNENKREQAEKKRYSAPAGSKVFIGCNHNNKRFLCTKIRPYDAVFIREKIFKCQNKVTQDSKIAGWIQVMDIKKSRPRISTAIQGKKPKPHAFHVVYSVPTKHGKTVNVCKKFFMTLTCMKNSRVNKLCKVVKSGEDIKENRGGDRISHKTTEKKAMVREFLGNLKGSESHYNRKKSKRIYLNCDLSQNKLRKAYNNSVTDQFKVTRTMFQRIFSQFNIGFKSPASDVCTFCNKITFQIKTEKNSDERSKLMMEKRVHTLRAKTFYDLLKLPDDDDTLTFCFDLQQVQPLPKTAIQEAFYSRQISFYAFCVVDQQSKRPVFYTWTEDQAGRGSVEFSSALIDFFKTYIIPQNKKNIRLFCDGCGGQNKNNIVVHSLIDLLYKHLRSSIENITLFFPVRGQSFLPADRVFGRTERKLRKKVSINTVEEYRAVYATVGTVKHSGPDWMIKDVKSLSQNFKNNVGIKDLKKIIITKINNHVKVTGQMYYRFEEEKTPTTLFKKGITSTSAQRFLMESLPLEHPIQEAKKKMWTHF
ncbi:unnamed protein product [Phaedon cochleariae]|uniref:Uncharacterized protein n=1 Tax=Phaedon cochleariae TaxID=80249 RepID=A0A9P0GHI4_PHACE|nr:unnamed protein product [Phaedon cochleariae]